METVLVTGGAGFVGSSLAIALQKTGRYNVFVIDNLKRRGSEFNLSRLQKYNIPFFHADIRNWHDLETLTPFQWLIECSAEPSVLAGYGESPCNVVHNNLTGMLNCLELVRRHQANIIFFSTSRVYPIEPLNALPLIELDTRYDLPADYKNTGISYDGLSETFPLEGIRSIYGATKLCGELMMLEYLYAYNLLGVINRCGLIAGPWQMGKTDQGVVALWVARNIYNKPIAYIGYGGIGKQVRDMLHIDDLTQLVLLQMEHIDRISGQTFNIGGGRVSNASLLEMTEISEQTTGNKLEIQRKPDTRPADIPWYITDYRKIQSILGWEPKKNAATIISDVVKWIYDNKILLEPVLNSF